MDDIVIAASRRYLSMAIESVAVEKERRMSIVERRALSAEERELREMLAQLGEAEGGR